jgi:hypothetical protein
MRIAQLAPLAESVPPKLYGGTERVVAWLVDGLVELGHEVTLFASGDSQTKGKLHSVWPKALVLASAQLARRRVRPDSVRRHKWIGFVCETADIKRTVSQKVVVQSQPSSLPNNGNIGSWFEIRAVDKSLG